jgi:hypothetical protein
MSLSVGAPKALVSHLTPERHRVLATLRQALLQIGEIGIKTALVRPTSRTFGKGLGVGVLAYGGTSQASGAADRLQGLACEMATAYLLIGRQSAGTAVGTGCSLSIAAAIGMQALARRAPVIAERNRKTPQASMGAGDPSFDGFSHVEEQVPPVSHLQDLGSSDGSSSGVLCRAVTSDDANPALSAQPRGKINRSLWRNGCRQARTKQSLTDPAVTNRPDRSSRRNRRSRTCIPPADLSARMPRRDA